MSEGSRCSLCRDHEVLFGRLQADRRVYAECARYLERSKPEEFEYAYQRAKDARNAYLKALKRLDVHIEEHCCER
jgi:hypothetical protein